MADKISKILCPKCRTKLDVSELDAFFIFNCPHCNSLLRVPKKFGAYYLDHLCGSGGMAKVYLATERNSGKRFALKIAMPQCTDESMKCFKNEYLLLKDLRHTNLTTIYGYSCINDFAVLFMEYIDGENLYIRLQNSPLPTPDEVKKMLIDATNALLALHKLKIVHHDIKPENFILRADGHLVLCDFDLADRREDDDAKTSCCEWGSPDYASPERLLHGSETYRGDIFSLGATFYDIITGHQPFAAATNQASHYDLRRKMDFAAVTGLRRDIPENISNLITDMMSFQEKDRPDYTDILARLQ